VGRLLLCTFSAWRSPHFVQYLRIDGEYLPSYLPGTDTTKTDPSEILSKLKDYR
jgi:hypothetical protein